MLKLQWPLCTIWVCVITHARSQSDSNVNVNYFQILKYPTELSGYEFNKNSLALCKDEERDSAAIDNDDSSDDTTHWTKSPTNNVSERQHNAFLLKMFTNIAQQLRQRPCGKRKSSTRMSTTTRTTAATETAAMAGSTIEPAATKTMASSGRSLRVYYKGQRPQQQGQGVMEGTFNILDQLKLDEKEQHKLKLQSQQGHDVHQQQQQQQQQLAGLPQAFWEEPTFEPLGKAGKKKKKKKKKKKRKKKKKPSKDKDKKKKKKKKRKKKKKQKTQKKPNHTPTLVGQPAHVLFAQQPHFQFQHEHDHTAAPSPPPLKLPLTTKQPQHHFTPIKKIKYILRKNTIFKKKKKEYLNHLKQVLYPFVKFIAFFTVLNPFTLAVFLFSLVSPVVFGFIGFIGLSFLIKPALSLLFGVKRTVSSINRKNLLKRRRQERLRNSQRPITIHKHYYQQTRIPRPAVPQHQQHRQRRPHRPRRPHPKPNAHRHHRARRHSKHFNPLLPHVRHKLKKDTTTSLFGPNFVR